MFGLKKCRICNQPLDSAHKEHTDIEWWSWLIKRGNEQSGALQASSCYLQAIAEMLLDIQTNGIKVRQDRQ